VVLGAATPHRDYFAGIRGDETADLQILAGDMRSDLRFGSP